LDVFVVSCLFGQIWDLASGVLKHTLVGHSDQVRGEELKYNYLLVMATILNWINNNKCAFSTGLVISNKHTYMFSAGDDKQVKCWDLEQNEVKSS
jgi:pleiotropic regulator 1